MLSPAEVHFHANASGEGGPRSKFRGFGIAEDEASKARAKFLKNILRKVELQFRNYA
jgi:hypothetical protein